MGGLINEVVELIFREVDGSSKKRVVIIILLCFLIGLTGCVYIATMQLVDDYCLFYNGQKITAKVSRVGISKGRQQIRYSFIIDNEQYSHSDRTGRRNLWTRYSDSVVKNANIEVLYYLPNPWLNKPFASINPQYFWINEIDVLVGIVVCVLLWGGNILLIISIKKSISGRHRGA